MLNKEQLDEIKARFENMQQQARTGFTADISAIEIAFQDVPALIAETERLIALIGVIYTEDVPEHLKEFIADKMGWRNE